jgi:hypothetical protein
MQKQTVEEILSLEDEAFMQQLILSEEDRLRLFPTRKWPAGGYRWFKSSNVVPIEKYQKAKKGIGGGRKTGRRMADGV